MRCVTAVLVLSSQPASLRGPASASTQMPQRRPDHQIFLEAASPTAPPATVRRVAAVPMASQKRIALETSSVAMPRQPAPVSLLDRLAHLMAAMAPANNSRVAKTDTRQVAARAVSSAATTHKSHENLKGDPNGSPFSMVGVSRFPAARFARYIWQYGLYKWAILDSLSADRQGTSDLHPSLEYLTGWVCPDSNWGPLQCQCSALTN